MENWILTKQRKPTESKLYQITCFDQSSRQNKTFIGFWDGNHKKFYHLIRGFNGYFQQWTVNEPIAWCELSEPFTSRATPAKE